MASKAKLTYKITPDTGVKSNDYSTRGDDTHGLALDGTGAANDTITVVVTNAKTGVAASLTTKVLANGTWHLATGTLADGDYTFAIKEAGTLTAAATSPKWTIDTRTQVAITGIAPDAGVSATDGLTSGDAKHKIKLAGTAEAGDTVVVTTVDPVSHQTVTVGTATAKADGSWTLTTGTLKDGAYTFLATATDKAGNTAAGTYGVKIDGTAPGVPTLAVQDDLGHAVASTNDHTLHVAGSTEAGATVLVSWKDAAGHTGKLAPVTAASNGAWSVDTGTLATGSYTFTATAADAAGNISKASSSVKVSVTAAPVTAPSVALMSQTLAHDTGASATDGITSDGHVTLSGAVSAGASVDIYDGATKLGAATVSGAAWSYDGVLAPGAHDLFARATGPSGLIADSARGAAVTVDTTAPSIVLTSQVLAHDTGASASDGLTNDGHVTLSGTIEAGGRVDVYDGATKLGAATVSGTAWTFAGALSEGSHDLSARAVDLAGNIADSAHGAAILVDTQITGATVSGVALAGDNIVTAAEASGATVPVTGTLSTALAADETLFVTVDGQTYAVQVTGTSFSVDVPTPSTSGTLSLSVVDKAGNATTPVTQIYTVPTLQIVNGVATLTKGIDAVAGDASDLLVTGTSATLNAGDQLIGGSGHNTLALYGYGSFDLTGLAAFSGFQELDVIGGGGGTLTASGIAQLSFRNTIGLQVHLSGGGAISETNTFSNAYVLDGGSYTYSLGSAGNTNARLTLSDTKATTLTTGETGAFGYSQQLTLGAGGYTVTLHYQTDVYANKTADLKAGDVLHGSGSDTLRLASDTFDLSQVDLSGFNALYAYGQGTTLVHLDTQTAKGFHYIGGDDLHTSDASLDLTGVYIGGQVFSDNATGTTFTVGDTGSAAAIRGGAGTDTLVYTGATPLTDTQRADIFALSSVEIIKEGAVQHATNMTGIMLTADPGGSTLVAGGAGGTTLVSGGGNDRLVGGPGAADTFVFKAGFGHDVVQGFQAAGANHGVIHFDPAIFADAASALAAAHQSGGDVQIVDPTNTGNTLVLSALDVHTLTASDFHIT